MGHYNGITMCGRMLLMLNYQPKAGSIVKCDFAGYVIPEIVKNRPVLVIHAHKSNPRLVTVVPISATAPNSIEYYHHELDLSIETGVDPYLKPCRRWFKCDLIYVVSIDRMDRLKNRLTGKRGTPQISSRTLNTVRATVKLANGL
jgi:uncharacterized protein YifN (PemK superfamily)